MLSGDKYAAIEAQKQYGILIEKLKQAADAIGGAAGELQHIDHGISEPNLRYRDREVLRYLKLAADLVDEASPMLLAAIRRAEEGWELKPPV